MIISQTITCSKMFSYDDISVFAFVCWNNHQHGAILKYDEQINVWNEINVDQTILSLNEKVVDTFIDCTQTFVAILHCAQKTNLAKFDEYDENVLLINVGNVLTLKDICFMKLFNTYNCFLNLSEK